MSTIRCLTAALCSAALLSIGIPNEFLYTGSPFFGLIACIPLYIGYRFCRSRQCAGLMYGLTAAAVHVLSSFWLIHFQDFAVFTLGASTVAYFFLGMPFGVILFYIRFLPASIRIFAFSSFIILWDWFKSSGFLAYPWGTAAMAMRPFRMLVQIADITGVWGITGITVLVAAVSAELLLALLKLPADSITTSVPQKDFTPLKRLSLFIAGLAMLILMYGQFRLTEKREPQKTLTLALIQQNTDSWVSGAFDETLNAIQDITEDTVTQAGSKPDMIVWSETSLIYGYDEHRSLYEAIPFAEPFTQFLARMNVPILTGSPLLQNEAEQHYSNAVYLLQPDGSIADTYAKMQLVCFAEYLPFSEYPLVQNFFDRLVGFSSGWTPGNRYTLFSLETQQGERLSFAAPICFEDAFPSLCADLHNQGSELLINLTNDSWSKTRSAEYQHFSVASFRAIELRTTLVRATNSGYSAVIDPTGAVIADMPLFTAMGKQVTIPVYAHTKTFYARWKDWLPMLALLCWCIGIVQYRSSASFCPKTVLYRQDALQHLDAAEKRNVRRKRCRITMLVRKKKHLRILC